MKIPYVQLIHSVRTSVNSHYKSLAEKLSSASPDSTKKIEELVHIEASRVRDNDTINDFTALVSRFFPDSSRQLRTEELRATP